MQFTVEIVSRANSAFRGNWCKAGKYTKFGLNSAEVLDKTFFRRSVGVVYVLDGVFSLRSHYLRTCAAEIRKALRRMLSCVFEM